ncbi:response regulator transcription factor [Microbacterium sp.]|uniref:response regulator transcription factor n=1 Tax=Microbacterium sp. TaxID=51671 RepID=UPI00281140E8|nr:helix-turn-helix transcriptional regulator [Microbacterium sp.]
MTIHLARTGTLAATIAAAVVSAVALVYAGTRVSDVESALFVPALFVAAGLLGPLWRAAPFTCALLAGIGAAHLLAFAASAAARGESPASAWWHLLSQLVFVVGFALLVVLAAGYPSGPAPRAARWSLLGCVLPVLAAVSAATPAVLGSGELGPIAAVLPASWATASMLVFALPLLAAVVAAVRFVRDGRDIRGRLTLPLGALVLVGLLLALGAVAQGGLATAAFLLAAPLLPVGLIAGSRPSTAASPPSPPPESADTALALLTPREREVLALMAEGRSNTEIGRALHISLSAVEKHSTAIFTKLGVNRDEGTHRRVAAVVAYLRGMR